MDFGVDRVVGDNDTSITTPMDGNYRYNNNNNINSQSHSYSTGSRRNHENTDGGHPSDHHHHDAAVSTSRSTISSNTGNHIDQSHSDSNSNKRKGRAVSTIWQYFTNVENPHQLKSGACMHCHKEVPYLKKIERVKNHLVKCSVFCNIMRTIDLSDRPEWFVEYHAMKNSSNTSSSSKSRKRTKSSVVTAAATTMTAGHRNLPLGHRDEKDDESHEEVVTVIHCWSAPRSRSTALLYSFEARNNNNVNSEIENENEVDDGDDEESFLLDSPKPAARQQQQYSTVALDEPLYAAWLLNESAHSNITRPYLPYVQKAARRENTSTTRNDHDLKEYNPMVLLEWQDQLQPLATKLRIATQTMLHRDWKYGYCRQKVIFCKHMAKFWSVYDRQRDEISELSISSGMTTTTGDTTTTTDVAATNSNSHGPDRIIRLKHYHVFLLRDPVDVVTSWNAIGTNVYGNMSSSSSSSSSTEQQQDNIDISNSNHNNNNHNSIQTSGGNTIHEIGMVPLLQIYSALHNSSNGTSVFVLDAEELIQEPERTLQRLCHHCHIPYTDAMMSWKSGPHACDGPWAKYWYHDVHQSTGWISKKKDDANDSTKDVNDNGRSVVVKPKKYRTFNPAYMTALRASYPAYTFLYRLTERYQQRTSYSNDQLYPDDARNAQVFVYIGNSPGYGQCVPRDMAGVSPFDSVVQGGDATWEGIRIYRGKILCLEKHLNRLMKSAKALGFNPQYMHTKEQITDAIFQVLAINNMRDGAHMRLTLTRGEKCTSSMNPKFNVYGTTLIILPEWKPVHGVTTYDNTSGISLITASQRRNPPSCVDSKIHHNNLINNILPKIQANLAGVADAIMLDIDGYVSETNATNLFMVDEHGTLLTPHADHCLPGITRSAVLELAQELRIRTEVRRISLAEFHSAQEVFTTGTMGELTPVVNIDGRIIGDGVCGPVTQQLQDLYQTLPDRYGWSTPIPSFE